MKSYKVVIVENDEDERFFMREEFSAFDAFTLIGEFINGDTLLEWLESGTKELPDIIVSDLNMPGKNGYDVISEIKSNPLYAHIQVIITSTSPVIAVQQKCLSMGASYYLIKPDTFIEYGPYVKDLYQKIQN